MTVQPFEGGFYWPHAHSNVSSLDEGNARTLDAASEAVGMIFLVPQDGNCIGASFTTNTVSVTAGPLTFVCSIQTVDGSGNPSGTLFHANATANVSIATTDDNKMFDVTFTSFALNGGDILALVVTAPGAGTFDVDIAMGRGLLRGTLPYIDHFTASWARIDQGIIMALKYDDGYHFISGAYPIATTTTTSFNNTSTPDEIGAKFQLPGPVRITGAWIFMDIDNNVDVVVYDSGDTPQLTKSLTSATREGTTFGVVLISFDGTFELAANTIARLVCKPTSASNIRVERWNVNTAAQMDAFSGGQNWHRTTRTDAGAWTDVLDEHPVMGLLIDGIGDDAGGGGGGGPGWMI